MRKRDDGLGKDEYRDRPRTASLRDLRRRANKMIVAVNFLTEEIAGLQHDIGAVARYDEPRPSFPVRYFEPEP